MPRESRRQLPASGHHCGGAGNGDTDNRDFPGRRAAVPGSISADCLRLCVLPEVGERRAGMNIVVWKSPKMLRGILRKLFKVKA